MLLMYSPGTGPCNCTGSERAFCQGLLGCARSQRVLTGTQQVTHSGTSVSARWDGVGRHGAAPREIPPAPAPPTAPSRQGHRVTVSPQPPPGLSGPQGARPAAPVPRTPRGDGDPRSAQLPPGSRAAPSRRRCTAGPTQASRAGSRPPGAAGSPGTATPHPPFPGRRAGLPDRSTGAASTGTALIPAALPPLTSLSPVPPPSASRRVCR